MTQQKMTRNELETLLTDMDRYLRDMGPLTTKISLNARQYQAFMSSHDKPEWRGVPVVKR